AEGGVRGFHVTGVQTCALPILYSSLGGFRGVILTDLLQFLLGLGGSILFAWIAVDSVGGISGLHAGLAQHYEAERVLSFLPGVRSEERRVGIGCWCCVGCGGRV